MLFNAFCVLLLVGARDEIFAACCSLLQGFDRYRESLSCGLRRTRHAANVARLAVSLQRRLRFVVSWSERRDIRYLLLTLARLYPLPRKLVLRTAPNSPCGKCRAPCCITSTPFAFCCRLERETRYSLPAAHSCKALSAAAKACPADCAELAMRQMSRALPYHFNAVCVLLLVGARDEIRTRDICLGKATLYH